MSPDAGTYQPHRFSKAAISYGVVIPHCGNFRRVLFAHLKVHGDGVAGEFAQRLLIERGGVCTGLARADGDGVRAPHDVCLEELDADGQHAAEWHEKHHHVPETG